MIGDVMGRGVAAAATMGQPRTAIRAFATLDLTPGQVLTHLNQLVLQLTDEQIVTCVYAVFDSRDGTLLLANAGYPPARRARCGRRRVHRADGDTLLLYTDGLVENRQRSADEGVSELTALLEGEAAATREPETLLDLLLGRMAQGSEHDDDVALLLVRTT